MKHNHSHSCACKHTSVKYCSHCRTVYCEDCNQEWTAKQSYTWNYQPYPLYSNDWQKSLGNQSTGNTPIDITPTITCSHKG